MAKLSLPAEGKAEMILSLNAVIKSLEERLAYMRQLLASVEEADIREKYDDKNRPPKESR